ncbi:hypothetical protein OHB00_35155 [Streptomyces sp. NBC_00631]|uniref:hypothetical protein n=1 Tax=Streptomyces sp. NBC_00631 TaxID=2975793 RepID=UPI0030E15C66
MTDNASASGRTPELLSSDDSGDAEAGGRHRVDDTMKRRRVLTGGATIATAGGPMAAHLTSADTVTAEAGSGSSAATSDTSAGVCSLTAEVTEGPYSDNTTTEIRDLVVADSTEPRERLPPALPLPAAAPQGARAATSCP